METFLTLSRGKIADFVACQRRFQLRYQEHLPWPIAPQDERAGEMRELGQRFHQLMHRRFLDLPIEEEINQVPDLHDWWEIFKNQGPALPGGARYPELSMTVPLGRHFLTGRFDLFIIDDDRAYIFDWKTDARPRNKSALQEDLQTRLYLWLAAEGAGALGGDIAPQNIALTYWYVNDPSTVLTFNYDQRQHEANLSRFNQVVNELDALLPLQDEWPLTEDLNQCSRCAYQLYCGRQTGQLDLGEWGQEDLHAEGQQPSQEPARL